MENIKKNLGWSWTFPGNHLILYRNFFKFLKLKPQISHIQSTARYFVENIKLSFNQNN